MAKEESQAPIRKEKNHKMLDSTTKCLTDFVPKMAYEYASK